MDSVSALFRQMVEEGIQVVKEHTQSLHLNDALRVFHQMRPMYGREPDALTYSYLARGLCVQGPTRNAREVFDEMRGKGLMPTEPACNSFVSALALAGEVGEAERVMWDLVVGLAAMADCWRLLVQGLTASGKPSSHPQQAIGSFQKKVQHWVI